jgi:hypothetical protein
MGAVFFMSKGLYIPVGYIEGCKDSPKKMKALALFLKLKTRYRNSIVYDYSPQKISKTFNTSDYEARIFVGEMVKMGLVEKQNYKNEVRLRLVSFRSIKEKVGHVSLINVHMTDKIDVVVIKLRHTLLRFSILNKQQYIKQVYTDLVKLDEHKAPKACKRKRVIKKMKGLQRLGYSFTNPENVDIKTCIGYRKAAIVCGLSVASVRPFLQRIKNWGYINGFSWYIKERPDIDTATLFSMRKYEISEKGFLFIKDNKVYQHMGTYISIPC